MTQGVLFSAPTTKGRNTLEVADDTGTIIDILRTTRRAFAQGAFINMVTLVTDGDFYVYTKIITATTRRNIQQRRKTLFIQCFLQIQVQCGAAIQIVDELTPV